MKAALLGFKEVLGLVLVAAWCGGCSTIPEEAPGPTYHASSTVTRTGEPSQYEVQFRILEVGRNGRADVLGSPKMVVKAGEECQIKLRDSVGESGVLCTALVTEFDDRAEATTNVLVTSAGHPKFVSSQTTVVPAQPAE